MTCAYQDEAWLDSLRVPLTWRSVCSVAAIICCAFASGCGGPTGPARFPVSGNVVREGQPVDDGTIQFIPTGGGPAASTKIKDGLYQFTKENGPVEGGQNVVIYQTLPRAEVPPGTPKKDAEILPETRFKKSMPREGWKLETTVAKDQDFKAPVDFDVDTAVAAAAGSGRKEKP